ncbi:Npun_F0296 family exosortase-dependent surface protein [Sphingomonas quercus]|uniref:PEPxxWA-CTERM sorting domain-containing protein n=1 Tax=Sphingomonas quercus TaxID=2842451 RepID=A0ABS6BPH1_9SPHN|nr:PEPxxWA-CTERM sorting domain-containing protein [Sphingomonas quercus]MBU3079164.1 PEPxxWA-CTERM sorting domain-containing protein [Sphingomonas quercus]
MKILARTAAAALATLVAAGSADAAIVTSVEAAGAQHSTRALTYGGENGLDGLSASYHSATDLQFGAFVSAAAGDFYADPANGAGGAGGTGNYLSASSFGTVLDFVDSTVNFFGLWVSTIDTGNTVTFFKGGNQVAEYNLADLFADHVAEASAYLGNPNAPFAGEAPGEAFAFFNFQSDQVFDRIWLTQNGIGGFEVDNLTLGYIARQQAGAALAMPEPASWAMMLVGFGAAGLGLRRRRGVPTIA